MGQTNTARRTGRKRASSNVVNISEYARKLGLPRETVRYRVRKGLPLPAEADCQRPGPVGQVTGRNHIGQLNGQQQPDGQAIGQTLGQRKSKKSKAMQSATIGQRVPSNSNEPSSIELVPAKRLWPSFVWPGFAATILAGLAIALAVTGAIVNARYYAALGQTTWDSELLAVFGLVVDGVTFALPTVASAMWRARCRASAISAWIIVAGFMVLRMIATAGFTSQNIGDAMAARAAVIIDAEASADQRVQAIEIARRAAETATSARQAECAIRGPRCRDDEAAERAALAELAKANNLPIEKAPAISAAPDPGAHMIGDLLESLGITERRVQYARTAGMTVAPATAGLLLSFSMMLLFSAGRPARRDAQYEQASSTGC
jgi:hypothetical protein